MEFLDDWGISIAVFAPVVAAAIMMLIPKRSEAVHKWVALGASMVSVGFGIAMLANFSVDRADELQYVVDKSWIDVINSRYIVGLDGIVNGSGVASDEAGQGLRQVQTGKVQQYAAIMFAAVAILAGILVIVAQ